MRRRKKRQKSDNEVTSTPTSTLVLHFDTKRILIELALLNLVMASNNNGWMGSLFGGFFGSASSTSTEQKSPKSQKKRQRPAGSNAANAVSKSVVNVKKKDVKNNKKNESCLNSKEKTRKDECKQIRKQPEVLLTSLRADDADENKKNALKSTANIDDREETRAAHKTLIPTSETSNLEHDSESIKVETLVAAIPVPPPMPPKDWKPKGQQEKVKIKEEEEMDDMEDAILADFMKKSAGQRRRSTIRAVDDELYLRQIQQGRLGDIRRSSISPDLLRPSSSLRQRRSSVAIGEHSFNTIQAAAATFTKAKSSPPEADVNSIYLVVPEIVKGEIFERGKNPKNRFLSPPFNKTFSVN